MAKAALAMESPPNLIAVGKPTGLVQDSLGGDNGTQIVHQDIKPENGQFGTWFDFADTDIRLVFLYAPHDTNFPLYPTVKVSDESTALD